MRFPAKLQDAIGVIVLTSDVVSLNTVRQMAALVSTKLQSSGSEPVLEHRRWPDMLRPTTVGQQALYVANLADPLGVTVRGIRRCTG